MGEARDKRELLNLAHLYLDYRRCIGGHVVHGMYVCPWCDSNNPDTYCVKEKIARKDEQDLPNSRAKWKRV